jgi:hypothetical protein
MAPCPDGVRETAFVPCLLPGSKASAELSLAISPGGNYHVHVHVSYRDGPMKSDRLVVLLAPEEKARLVALARARRSSVGELVRGALSALNDSEECETDADRPGRSREAPLLPADQAAALERLAEVALRTMQRANAALDEAFEEVEATKAYFAAKRSQEPERELAGQDR